MSPKIIKKTCQQCGQFSSPQFKWPFNCTRTINKFIAGLKLPTFSSGVGSGTTNPFQFQFTQTYNEGYFSFQYHGEYWFNVTQCFLLMLVLLVEYIFLTTFYGLFSGIYTPAAGVILRLPKSPLKVKFRLPKHRKIRSFEPSTMSANIKKKRVV